MNETDQRVARDNSGLWRRVIQPVSAQILDKVSAKTVSRDFCEIEIIIQARGLHFFGYGTITSRAS